ncbi:MAG: hypothetical protein JW784_06750 [Candidatus Cloacimonetes bacterium]|nr:hypothetical protein [Candidatus Cloacimonadota bacterium]
MRYTLTKFLSFDRAKRVKIILSYLNNIEKGWDDIQVRQRLIGELQILLNAWQEAPVLPEKLSDLISRHQLFEIIVPLERQFSHPVRDHDFLDTGEDGSRQPDKKINLSLILHDLRSSFNTGSIFRTAEYFGLEKIFLSGYTPVPGEGKIARTAMGTEKMVNWQRCGDVNSLISDLQSRKFQVVALETVSTAPEIHKAVYQQPCCLLVGNEALGLPEELMKKADVVVRIPGFGWKNSLNVGVALAVTAYEIFRQWSEEAID